MSKKMICFVTSTKMSAKSEILQQLAIGEITAEEAEELLSKLNKPVKGVHLKVTPKGCIGIYGIRKMPISLYHREFKQISQAIDDGTFETFISENKDKLKMD